MEIIAAMVYKLIDGASPKDYEEAGWAGQYTQHNHSGRMLMVYPGVLLTLLALVIPLRT